MAAAIADRGRARRAFIELVPAADPGRPPTARNAVGRPRLVEPLCRPDAPPLVVLVAPAGYGKTTVLEEWADRDPRPFAWISLGEPDNEPGRLELRVAGAIDRARERARGGRFVLVLDELHALHGRAALDVVAAVAGGLPAQATLALASRSEPSLPIARLRAERRVSELRERELAMTRAEAAALLQRAGMRLERTAVDVLLSRTEGWPVGLTLAALSLGEHGGAGGALARFGGDDRLVADYLREEVLAPLAPHVRDFLQRTSVLEMLTGPACDAVLQRSGSAAVLAELACSNVLIVRLDRTDEHFRYHRLLAQMLRAELRRGAPAVERELHRRASEFCRDAGDVDGGVRHALLAGDPQRAGELVCGAAGAAVAGGRGAAVEHWLSRFTSEQIAAQPALALAAAASALARGQGHVAEYWAAAADGQHTGVGAAAMRAAVGPGGVRQMRADAAAACAADTPWRPLACLLAGTADALLGDPGAVERLEEGARRAAVTAPHLHALCLAQLAVLELSDDDWEAAVALITRARAQVDRYSLGAAAASALVFAVSAAVRARRGRTEDARRDLERAERLGEALTDFPHWYCAELRILMARAALRLSDAAGARSHLTRAARHAARAPDATVLARWLKDAWSQCDAFSGGDSAETSALTGAELRILGYLPTHLSFRQIAERTSVSANTVKTQANAVYRKLDVSCRSDAVARAREVGLIDTTAS